MNTFFLLTLRSFFLLTLFLSICVSLCKPSPHDGGFTVDIIHRDSPQSPLYNPNNSLTDRLQNAFLQSTSRAFHLSKRPDFASKIDADVFSNAAGDFIMKIRIGTPPVEAFGSVNLVSDLTWVQCEPSNNCRKQVGLPFLVPASSSTYRAQPCRSKACQALDTKLPCDTQNICHYEYSYENGFYTKGVLSTDTFWLGPTTVKQVLFGYSHNNTCLENAIGIIGLGGDSLSLISQLKPIIQGKFSYCLMSHIHDGSNQTSKIHFGDRAIVSGSNVFSTPIIVKKYYPTYYHINLMDVLVGNKKPSYNQSLLDNILDHVENGNMIVDFESALTAIPADMYGRFSPSITSAIGGKSVNSPQGYDQICYKDLNVDRVPTVTLRFDGGDIEVPPVNLFMEVQKGVSCLTIIRAEDSLGMLGNLVQRNLMVGFDLIKQKVYFKPTDCSMQ